MWFQVGYFILDTRDRLAYGDLMAAIVVIGACGFLIDSVARAAFRGRRRRAPSPSRERAPADPAASRPSPVPAPDALSRR